MQKTVVILGMHRSGTSMVAGMLECLGVDLGEDQPGKQWSNPLGHYEDVDFLSLNKDILSAAGGSWDNPPGKSAILAQGDKFQSRINELISRKKNQDTGSPWGWKDPRTSLTIDLYYPYLHNPTFIWCRRDQNAVSRSLLKRNKIKIPDGLELLEYYENQIRDFFNRHPKIPAFEIDYDEVIKAPEKWINELIQFLQIDPDQIQIDQALEQVLAPEKLRKEKRFIWITWLVSIPFRLVKRIFSRN